MPNEQNDGAAWDYAVVGCDSHDCPKYLGFTNTWGDAEKLSEHMKTLGWRRLAVFDANLREVTSAPKQRA